MSFIYRDYLYRVFYVRSSVPEHFPYSFLSAIHIPFYIFLNCYQYYSFSLLIPLFRFLLVYIFPALHGFWYYRYASFLLLAISLTSSVNRGMTFLRFGGTCTLLIPITSRAAFVILSLILFHAVSTSYLLL